jgi:hypothetical protein
MYTTSTGNQLTTQPATCLYINWLYTTSTGNQLTTQPTTCLYIYCLYTTSTGKLYVSWLPSQPPVCISTGCIPHPQVNNMSADYPANHLSVYQLVVYHIHRLTICQLTTQPATCLYINWLYTTSTGKQYISWLPSQPPVCISTGCIPHLQVNNISADYPASHLSVYQLAVYHIHRLTICQLTTQSATCLYIYCLYTTSTGKQYISWLPSQPPVCISTVCIPQPEVNNISADYPVSHLGCLYIYCLYTTSTGKQYIRYSASQVSVYHIHRQWWASLHDVITALQIGRYQFCLKR